MRLLRLLCNFATKSHFISRGLSILTTKRGFHNFVEVKSTFSRTVLATNKVNGLLVHTETDENEELLEEFAEMETEQIEPFENARDILFKNSNDRILTELNKCVSVDEVLNLVKKHIDIFEDAHIVQTIFVLKDLQNICYHYSSAITAKTFVENLCKSKEFQVVIKYVENKLSSFNPEYLSYVLLYLYKLGIPVENPVVQNISLQIRDSLLTNLSLDVCSRFLKVIFSENSVRPYYMSLNLIPKITSQIGECESVESLGNLTTCLKRLHNIVTNKILEDYKKKVKYFLNSEKLKEDYRVLLKIILFLNHPKWRNQNVVLTSDCIWLMENKINILNVTEVLSLYEVFFKNQEPGEILNSIQRCSVKHLQRFETQPLELYIRLKLLASLIYFSSPTHRMQFRKDIHKYLKQFDNYRSFILLRQIFSRIKVSDEKLCSKYWDLFLNLLDDKENKQNVLGLCQNYMYFHADIDNYRHYKFEHRMMKIIRETIKDNMLLFPAVISGYLSFAMVYGKSEIILTKLLDKFEQNLSQFHAGDCLKISNSILLSLNIRDSCIQKNQINRIKDLLNKRTEDIAAGEDTNFLQNNILVKAAILRNDYDNYTIESLLMKYKEMDYMSSKFIENICYMFLTTDTLIPEVINKCTEYIIKYPKNILGFNAQKMLDLCFYVAYYPINADKFFEVITDIIIRDQERLSGLAVLQSALSLCYFNKLPSSLIKQIFNVEFLDKLDVELANCYSKDKYPQRVRNSLMQLNRAVCLEYPEYNIPWFHKKYIEEIQYNIIQKRFIKSIDKNFTLRISEYLAEIVGKPEHILENVITPYGYHIDFVINLNNKAEAVPLGSMDIKRRVALLLMRQHGFTRFYTHLKGKYQLKKRHLEILGYSVVVIKFNEWINLLYAEERLEYLSKVLWPSDLRTSDVCKR